MDDSLQKISVKVWRPVIDKLNGKLDKACLRRDAFLNKVLEIEVPYLDVEVTRANSVAANRFIAEKLDRFDRKLVSLSLQSNVVAQLNRICAEKRIVRDAFFNRLFFLLAASPKVIDTLFFLGESDKWRTDVWSERKHDGPFFQNVFYPLEPDIDPFWPLRTGIEMHYGDIDLDGNSIIPVERPNPETIDPVLYRLYTATFFDASFKDVDLYGFNCYLPDSRVPGHPDEIKARTSLDDLLLDI